VNNFKEKCQKVFQELTSKQNVSRALAPLGLGNGSYLLLLNACELKV
jgi:hypothetical protein